MEKLGKNIKSNRLKRGLSLRELAAAIHVTPSMLSQVENNKTLPSLVTIKNIADELDTTVDRLIQGNNESTSPVLLKTERRKVSRLDGIGIDFLTVSSDHKQMEPLLITLQKDAVSGTHKYRHFGQEFVLVLSGKIKIFLDNDAYELSAGDTIYFNSTRLHDFCNIFNGESEVLWVITPPSF
ncbi:MAG: hypothetical protein A2096_03490 [Spirochaetes bacterium GWF1_41_5]|nr:MAG: hypothetical protein A2096_03490 [Spirochaetes bacterium GWF1_41_5]